MLNLLHTAMFTQVIGYQHVLEQVPPRNHASGMNNIFYRQEVAKGAIH